MGNSIGFDGASTLEEEEEKQEIPIHMLRDDEPSFSSEEGESEDERQYDSEKVEEHDFNKQEEDDIFIPNEVEERKPKETKSRKRSRKKSQEEIEEDTYKVAVGISDFIAKKEKELTIRAGDKIAIFYVTSIFWKIFFLK